MNVQPTTDPDVSAALREAIDEVARQASSYRSYNRSHAASYGSPQRPVDEAMLHSLERLARSLGYQSTLNDLGPVTPFSGLEGRTIGWPHFKIELNSRLTLRKAISTYGHEISHILLGHTSRTYEQSLQRRMLPRPIDGDPYEEAACELAAAAMVRVLGIGDGRSEATFIQGKLHGFPAPQYVKDAALMAARVLWTAIGEHTPAYAAA